AERDKIIAFRTPGSDKIRILRVLGAPGDEIRIYGGVYYVNNKLIEPAEKGQRIYVIYNNDPARMNALTNYSFAVYSHNYYSFVLSKADVEEIKRRKLADSIYIGPVDSSQIQHNVINIPNTIYRNSYYLGPFRIPKRGAIITDQVLSLIPTYLKNENLGEKISDDYFFAAGDNFPQSKDSRYIGLIPRSQIIGTISYSRNRKIISVGNER
ncbi:MAG: hypothetical protein EOP48_34505, partial [Sphingobacteriales bacterium]